MPRCRPERLCRTDSSHNQPRPRYCLSVRQHGIPPVLLLSVEFTVNWTFSTFHWFWTVGQQPRSPRGNDSETPHDSPCPAREPSSPGHVSVSSSLVASSERHSLTLIPCDSAATNTATTRTRTTRTTQWLHYVVRWYSPSGAC